MDHIEPSLCPSYLILLLPMLLLLARFIVKQQTKHEIKVAKHALAGRVVDARNPGRKMTREDQTMDLDAEYSRYEVGSSNRCDTIVCLAVRFLRAVITSDAIAQPVDQ